MHHVQSLADHRTAVCRGGIEHYLERRRTFGGCLARLRVFAGGAGASDVASGDADGPGAVSSTGGEGERLRLPCLPCLRATTSGGAAGAARAL